MNIKGTVTGRISYNQPPVQELLIRKDRTGSPVQLNLVSWNDLEQRILDHLNEEEKDA